MEGDKAVSDGLIELAQLLKASGYSVHGVDAGQPVKEAEKVELFYTVKVSRYVSLG